MSRERVERVDHRGAALAALTKAYKSHVNLSSVEAVNVDWATLQHDHSRFRSELVNFSGILSAADRTNAVGTVDTRNQVLATFKRDIRGYTRDNYPARFLTEVLLGVSELEHEGTEEGRADMLALVAKHKGTIMGVFGIATSARHGRHLVRLEHLVGKVLDGELMRVYPDVSDPRAEITS